jgi:anti-sigma factor ChrR (cupin superfamily)
VKLRQMQTDDDAYVRVNTLDPGGWQEGRDGEHILPLYVRPDEEVVMLQWQGGSSFARQVFPGGAEYFVIEGAFEDENGRYDQGTWLRLPAGSSQTIKTAHGARIWRKTGHLADA